MERKKNQFWKTREKYKEEGKAQEKRESELRLLAALDTIVASEEA